MAPALIVITGADGSGKSTICSMLAKYGLYVTREPGASFWPNRALRQILIRAKRWGLKSLVDWCFYYDHLIHVWYLKQMSGIVVCDRWYPISSAVYRGHSRKTPSWDLVPTKVIYIKVDPHVAAERIAKRADRERAIGEIEIQLVKIADAYEDYLKGLPMGVLETVPSTNIFNTTEEVYKIIKGASHERV